MPSTNNTITISNGSEIINYKFSESPNGHLAVSSAKIHEPFKDIKCTSETPTNRKKFSLSILRGTIIALIGGDGTSIDSTEIWLFDTKSNSFKKLTTTQKPLKRRSGHCAVAAGDLIYVFGGTYGLEISADMVIFTIDFNNNSYAHHEIELQNNWPCPRTCHTMIHMNNTIWLFGGLQDNGQPLNDLWELNYSLFPLSPNWHPVELKRAPPGRHSHVAWTWDNDFFIAGGLGEDDKIYNEVWRYHNISTENSNQTKNPKENPAATTESTTEETKVVENENSNNNNNVSFLGKTPTKQGWEQTAIINSHNMLYACPEFGLLEITADSSLQDIHLLHPFAALNGLFERLKFKQSEITRKIIFKEKREERDKIDTAQYRKFAAKIDKCTGPNVQSQMPPQDYQEIVDYFSEAKQNELKTKICNTRAKLSTLSTQIMKQYPLFLKYSVKNPIAEELATQLSLKLQQTEAALQREKEERMSEIKLYTAHLNQQKQRLPQMQKIDPADFNTFIAFSNVGKLSGQAREEALDIYYMMQLREYQKLKKQTQAIQAKIKKENELQSKRAETVSRLSNELTKKFKNVTKAEEELKKWTKWLNEANEDLEKVKNFLSAADAYQHNRQKLEGDIKAIEQNIDVMKQQLKKEMSEIVGRKKEPIEQLLEKIKSLSERIRPKNASDAQTIIGFEYQAIKELRDKIIQ